MPHRTHSNHYGHPSFSHSLRYSSPDAEVIETTKRSLENVLAGRYLCAQAVPYFAPTNLAELPPVRQQAEAQRCEEVELGNRVRAALHACLNSAVAALDVSHELLKDSGALGCAERMQQLRICASDMQDISAATSHAASLLRGERRPDRDTLMEIRHLTTL